MSQSARNSCLNRTSEEGSTSTHGLERDELTTLFVVGLEDHAHPTGPEPAQQGEPHVLKHRLQRLGLGRDLQGGVQVEAEKVSRLRGRTGVVRAARSRRRLLERGCRGRRGRGDLVFSDRFHDCSCRRSPVSALARDGSLRFPRAGGRAGPRSPAGSPGRPRRATGQGRDGRRFPETL